MTRGVKPNTPYVCTCVCVWLVREQFDAYGGTGHTVRMRGPGLAEYSIQEQYPPTSVADFDALGVSMRQCPPADTTHNSTNYHRNTGPQ